MSEGVSSKRIWKSFFLFILSQLGIAILLHHEGAPSTKVLGVLAMPVILILFFLVYVGIIPSLQCSSFIG